MEKYFIVALGECVKAERISTGVLASLLWDRALGNPLERPGSVTSEWMKGQAEKAHA